MWLTKYALAVPKNLVVGVNFRLCSEGYGGKYLFFVSSRSVKMRGFSFLSLYKSVFIFQFLNVKIYNYGKQNIIVNFIIKKLKKTQFPQKV